MNFAPVPVREQAIVWEIRPKEARGALVHFGAEQRFVLGRTWSALRGAPLPSFLKLKQFRKVPVVVSLHPELARTFILPFRLSRKKADAPLQSEDLQSMLRDFLGKTTFEMRRIAAADLGVEELDAILLDARLIRLLVDGAEVRENRTIGGRKVEGFLQVILTTREVFQDLHDLVHSGGETFFTERGPAALAFAGRHLQEPLTFLDLEDHGGWMFQVDDNDEEILRKVPFRWDAGQLPGAFIKAWGVSEESASKLYGLFLEGGFSDHLQRFARGLFAPAEEQMAKALGRTKARSPVFIRATIPPSADLPGPIGGTEALELPLERFMEESGLEAQFTPLLRQAGLAGKAEASFFLLPLLEYYYYRGDPYARKALTKHIHWIGA